MAEWSKALVLGTSLSGGVGSNPTPVIILYVTFLLPETPGYEKAPPPGLEPGTYRLTAERSAN